MRKIKNERAITLISLVITIVILLILAGLVIQSLTNTRLFEKTKQAKEEYQNSQDKENETIAEYENKIASAGTNISKEVTEDKLNEIIEEKVNEINSISFEEKKIWKFIDDKPLYQKTIKADYTTEDTQYINHNIPDVDNIYIDVGNTFLVKYNSARNTNLYSPFISIGVSKGVIADGYLTVIQCVDKERIQLRASNNGGSGTAYITLKYTKTTD